jgi:hypothetical protein
MTLFVKEMPWGPRSADWRGSKALTVKDLTRQLGTLDCSQSTNFAKP